MKKLIISVFIAAVAATGLFITLIPNLKLVELTIGSYEPKAEFLGATFKEEATAEVPLTEVAAILVASKTGGEFLGIKIINSATRVDVTTPTVAITFTK